MTAPHPAPSDAAPPLGGGEPTYGQKGRALYEAFWARNGDTSPTPWDDQARAIRTMWMNIARDADPLYAARPQSGEPDVPAEVGGLIERLRRTFAVFPHDNHGGYGLCCGNGQVWVDDGEASNFYRGGTCERCADNSPAPVNPDGPEAATALEALSRKVEGLRGALERVLDLETRPHHDGYDSGPGGGSYVYRDVVFTDEAFPIIAQALATHAADTKGEG